MTTYNDQVNALEQNMRYLSTNLCNLVDADETETWSNLSTSLSNFSTDTYSTPPSSQDISMSDNLHYGYGYTNNTNQNLISSQKSDSSGYLSSTSSMQYFPGALHQGMHQQAVPPPPPGLHQHHHQMGSLGQVFSPQMHGFNGIQFPTAAMIQANAQIQSLQYMQSLLMSGLQCQTFPMVESNLNVGDLTALDLACGSSAMKNSMPTIGFINTMKGQPRRGHSFHKKYPRRSEKDFMVVPTAEMTAQDELSEEIDLRKLKIGPDHLYQSEQTKLINKFKKALSTLSDLANERQDVEHSIFQNSIEKAPSVDYNKDITGYYQFIQYLKYIQAIVKDEYIVVRVIFQKLEGACLSSSNSDFDARGTVILNEMHQKINRLSELESLSIIRGEELDVNRRPDEIKVVKSILDGFILAVRNVAVDLWCLKVLYQRINSGQNGVQQIV